jgi:hypothetical protein
MNNIYANYVDRLLLPSLNTVNKFNKPYFIKWFIKYVSKNNNVITKLFLPEYIDINKNNSYVLFDIENILYAILSTKPSLYLGLISQALSIITISPSTIENWSFFKYYELTDNKFMVYLQEATLPYDFKVTKKNGIKYMIQDLTTSFMDKDNYIENTYPGDYKVEYIIKSNIIVLNKIVSYENNKRISIFKQDKNWDYYKKKVMYKHILNYDIFLHGYTHIFNGYIFLNYFNLKYKNDDILKLLLSFSEDMNTLHSILGIFIFGKMKALPSSTGTLGFGKTSNIISKTAGLDQFAKKPYMAYTDYKKYKSINDIIKEHKTKLVDKHNIKFPLYDDVKNYLNIISCFVNNYIKMIKFEKDEIKQHKSFVKDINEKFGTKFNNINSILSEYINNILFHSMIHNILSYCEKYNEVLNNPYLFYKTGCHDDFLYNIKFWINDDKYENIIDKFINDINVLRDKTKNNKFGIFSTLSSAINQ